VTVLINILVAVLVCVAAYGVYLMFKGWKLITQRERAGIQQIALEIIFVLMMIFFALFLLVL
jgi:hypothetical protein